MNKLKLGIIAFSLITLPVFSADPSPAPAMEKPPCCQKAALQGKTSCRKACCKAAAAEGKACEKCLKKAQLRKEKRRQKKAPPADAQPAPAQPPQAPSAPDAQIGQPPSS